MRALLICPHSLLCTRRVGLEAPRDYTMGEYLVVKDDTLQEHVELVFGQHGEAVPLEASQKNSTVTLCLS